jgi:predicted RNA-binding Zn ribbon-like protein
MRRFTSFGNHVALDFVNTLEGRFRHPVDLLGSVEGLIAWLVEAGLVEAGAREVIEQRCADDPTTCDRALEEAISLREALWRVFFAIASGDAVPDEAIEEVNRVLALAPRILQLEPTADRDLGCRTVRTADELLSYVILVAEAAADFLSSANASRLRKCSEPTCSGLFYDRSRAAERRWCEMKTCGNRAKAARHYNRRKARRA